MYLLLAASIACAGPPAAPVGDTVRDAFPPPPGAERLPADPFAQSLQALALRSPDEPVRTYDGRAVGHRARVVDLPLVPGDLQQCADSAIRLRAEHLRAQGAPVLFHATSGDAMPWSRYEAGERAYESGNRLAWKQDAPASWEQYLSAVFTWAGSSSLAAYDTVPDTEPDPGDLLVQGGSPGHVVVLLDVARRGEEVFVLVGEGFMPAQDFHVELGPEAGWWRWEPGLTLPHWTFTSGALRRWEARAAPGDRRSGSRVRSPSL